MKLLFLIIKYNLVHLIDDSILPFNICVKFVHTDFQFASHRQSDFYLEFPTRKIIRLPVQYSRLDKKCIPRLRNAHHAIGEKPSNVSPNILHELHPTVRHRIFLEMVECSTALEI